MDELIPKRSVSIPVAGSDEPLYVYYKGFSNGIVTLELVHASSRLTVECDARPLRAAAWGDIVRMADKLFNAEGDDE